MTCWVTAWFCEVVQKYDLFPAWVYYDSYSARYFVEEMQMQGFNNGNIVPIKNQSPKQRIDGTAALLDCYVGLYEHYNEYTGAIQ